MISQPSDAEVLQYVVKAINRSRLLARNQSQNEVLTRLVDSLEAKKAWLSLARKKITYPQFSDVVNFIGNAALRTNLDESQKKTASAIRDAGKKAADLATQLKELIQENSTLRFPEYLIRPTEESAALSRLRQGLKLQALLSENYSNDYFNESVEKECNEFQARDFPTCAWMTSRGGSTVFGGH